MSVPRLTVRSVEATAVTVPLARPIRTAVGTIPAAPLVLIEIQTEEGPRGCAYIFAYTPAALAGLHRLVLDISAELTQKPAAPLDVMCHWDRRFRLLGWQGLVGMAVSGLDMALWDALGRAAEAPVATLLGAAPKPLLAYASFGLIDPAADGAAIETALSEGFQAIKIKVGGGDLARDIAAVKLVRSIAGPDIRLMIDYNQSLDGPEAIRRIRRLAAFDLHWVEEPVAAENLAGHAEVRAACGVSIQTGENWWFPADMAAALAAGASDHAMPDLMKIGGFTGWMQAAALASVRNMPISSHIFVEASAHALAATPTAHMIEHLDKASAILVEPLAPKAGHVTARGPGLGIEFDRDAVARFKS
ncbi:MAG TPA: enolase C-terminal domain-like protein [Dongiaceae bacterium]|jgi:mandelate racemase